MSYFPNACPRTRVGRRRALRYLTLASLLAAALPAYATEEVVTPPPDAERLESGVVMKVLEAGTGSEHPDFNDQVAVHFVGYTPEGVIARSTADKGQPIAFPMELAFPGWREGLTRMVVGEKRRLWLPDDLAPPTGEHAPLVTIFDFELVAIRAVPNPPEHLAKPDPEARRTDSGAYSKVVTKGTGTEKSHPEGRVLAHYVLWGEDGKVADSTYQRGRPTAFLLDKVMLAFSEVLQDMVVGEKRHIWIPAALNDGLWPKAPKKGPMIFEVELLRILPDSALEVAGEAEGS